MAKRRPKGASGAVYRLRRAELEARIEELIALLDVIDGDPDIEDTGDDEPSIGFGRSIKGKEEYDLEEDKSDYEPNLGWSEAQSLRGCIPTGDEFGSDDPAAFTGEGQHIARDLLREKVKDRRKLANALDATRVSPACVRFV